MVKMTRTFSPEILDQPFWALDADEALGILGSGRAGLIESEVQKRKREFGENIIAEKTRLSRTRIFVRQLKSPLILILVVAGAIMLGLREWIDASVIFAAVLANTVLGFWQENKAETVLENLRSYVRTRCRVRRGGVEHEIDARDLVPGDIIRVTQGDRVPADCRIIDVNSCEVDESVLTGESLPVAKTKDATKKTVRLADRKNMLYGGTLVMGGYAEAVVTGTGSRTEFGRIAALSAGKEHETTPLQRAISRFSLWVGVVIAFLTLLLFFGGLFGGYDVKEMFLIAVAVAVSSVPEGLPVALTVILAVGVERLAKQKGVVRKLLAAETLGSADLILTDKTGTLTLAKMELSDILPEDGMDNDELLAYAVLNTDVAIENPDDSAARWRLSGRGMEQVIVKEAGARGVLLPRLRKQRRLLERIPFNSTQKYSTVVVERDGKTETILMGAPEIIVQKSSSSAKDALLKEIDRRAEKGERLLGILVNDRVAGFLAFRDPIRPSVKAAVRRMQDSGVRTVIVTGDHRGTAVAVAREIGILKKGGKVVSGDDLERLSDDELKKMLPTISVFARVTPEQKMKLVRLYKKAGHVVAVTGDGVNDGPALRAADIGVAVGSGTDVAKSAADLIILDDNFETIVRAIEEGRQILGNIRKVIVYLLSDALDELFLIGGALVVGLALPINALQILFVNFFSDSFPALAFAFEKNHNEPWTPDQRSGRVITGHMRVLIFGVGALGSGLLFALYAVLLQKGHAPELVRTFIFASFAVYSLIVAFSLRSLRTSLFSYSPFSNRFLLIGVIIGLALTALAIYAPPFQFILKTTPLPPIWVAGIFAFSAVNIALVEGVKWTFRHYRRASS